MSFMQTSELEGMNVLTKDGRHIGDIRSAEVNTHKWTVDTVSVRLSRDVCKELGIEPKLIGREMVDIPTNRVSAVGDTVILNATLEELDEIRKQPPAHRAAEAAAPH